jgi:hypothetical protein
MPIKILWFLVILLGFNPAAKAYLCSDETPTVLWVSSEVAFFGELLAIIREPGAVPVLQMRVLKSFKGDQVGQIDITSDEVIARSLKVGKKYVILARQFKGHLPETYARSKTRCKRVPNAYDLLEYESAPTFEKIFADISEARERFASQDLRRKQEHENRLGICDESQLTFVEKGECTSIKKGTCRLYQKYIVETEERNEVGQKIRVGLRNAEEAQPSCKIDGPWIFKLEDEEEANYYIGIMGDYLLVDFGTGPDRGFSVYNLAKGSLVFRGIDVGDLKVRDGRKVFRLWVSSGQEATARNCPDFDENRKGGLMSMVQREADLTLSSGKVTPTGKVRCVPTQ